MAYESNARPLFTVLYQEVFHQYLLTSTEAERTLRY